MLPLLTTRTLFISGVTHTRILLLRALLTVTAVPGRDDVIHAAGGFQLFATRTVSALAPALKVIPPDIEARGTAAEQQQPQVSGAGAERKAVVRVGSRRLSTRDLMKWCHRIHALCRSAPFRSALQASDATVLPPLLTEAIFVEALDCFLAGSPAPSEALSTAVGAVWDLPAARVQYFLVHHKPR